MASKTIELRPDRSLLNPAFDGYKLSLQNVDILRQDLEVHVDRLLPDVNSYSLLHARIFGLHNHLIGDSDDGGDVVYFVDSHFKVQKTYKDTFSPRLVDCIEVWEIPKKHNDRKGHFNVSLKILSGNLAALGDGAGTLYILNTGSRSDDEKWQGVYSGEVIGSCTKFEITDATLKTDCEPPVMHLILNSITQEANERCTMLLHWVTLSKVHGSWGQVALRELKSSGKVHYSHFNENCQAIYVISDNGCKFILDSENPILKKSENNVQKVTKYTWSQNREDISIKHQLSENVSKAQIEVKSTRDSIEIRVDVTEVLSGKLFGDIDSDVTTWTLENDILQVVVKKEDIESMWPELVVGDTNGEYIIDTCILEETRQCLGNITSENEETPQTGTTFNSQEVEECDFDEDKTSIFERLSCITHEVTHKAALGTNQVILTVNFNQDVPPAFGVRHDVDVCLWRPNETSDDFAIEHKGTLNAFGYIQASKQQRKFTVCSPDLSYAAICETTRHIFIYRQKTTVASGELRNRNSGQRVKSIAQQQVITLPNEEIIGICAFNTILFLLTEKAVLGVML